MVFTATAIVLLTTTFTSTLFFMLVFLLLLFVTGGTLTFSLFVTGFSHHLIGGSVLGLEWGVDGSRLNG